MSEEVKIVTPEAGPLSPEQQAAAAAAAARPTWLPEKFKSPEDMAAAYASLEQKLGAPAEKPEADPKKPVENEKPEGEGEAKADPDVTPVSYGKAVDSALVSAGMTPDAVAKEWADNKTLSEETYTKLEGAGFSRQVVDTYVKGFKNGAQEATAFEETEIAAVKAIAGGDEGYTHMLAWAKQNLPQGEVDAYNRVMDSGDGAIARLAASGLHAKFVEAEGREPNLVQGGARPTADQYRSWKELETDMAAARKTGDPAKIRAVEQKALRSNL